jgi:nitrate/TMAO reductase-like tetraheme cytochrome c subunit
MKSAQWMTPAILLAGLALLATGCGEGGKESPHRGRTAAEAAGRELGSDASGAAYVGADLCLGCHLDEAASCNACHPQYRLRPEAVAAYLESRHANGAGRMDAAPETASCRLACHDPVGDGSFLQDRPDLPGPVPAAGLAAVGCEACHGGGARHFGRGPLSDPRPGAGVCGRCHGDLSGLHAADHPEGLRIWAAYQASPHARSLNEHVFTAPGSGAAVALCAKCHADQGARQFANVAGGHDELEALLPPTLPPVAGAEAIQCRTCHDPHNPSALLRPAAGGASAEFRTCTACHQVPTGAFGSADAYHGEHSAFVWSDDQGAPTWVAGIGNFDPSYIIDDTHFDNPATPGIEGYNLKTGGARTCRDCHDVHAADPTVHRQWAQSGHGGRIAQLKAAETQPETIRAAAVGEATGPAWSEADFKSSGNLICQRCHTATGFANYASDPVRYDPARNDFSHLTGLQKEMLYCWGCHADNAGNRRTPGPMVARYTRETVAYPDVGDSNLCMACHTGRESGAQISPAGIPNPANANRPGAHYLAAAAILFGEIGYMYAGLDYETPSTESHHRIGESSQVLDARGVRQGPCVACHMRSTEPHRFDAVEKNAGGGIAEIRSEACASCHKDLGFKDLTLTAATLEQKRRDFEDALDALVAQLAAFGFHRAEVSPYFFAAPYQPGYVETGDCDTNLGIRNWQTGGTTVWTWNPVTNVCVPTIGEVGDPQTGWNNMGAAFNLHLLRNEPGAYVHNRTYVARLIHDSVDWLDNNVLDNSAVQTLTTGEAHVGKPHRAGALRFLSNLGR